MSAAPKIERGIPVPERKRYGHYSGLFRQMQVGDSVLLSAKEAATARTTFQRFAPMRFISRSVEGGIRIWRVE